MDNSVHDLFGVVEVGWDKRQTINHVIHIARNNNSFNGRFDVKSKQTLLNNMLALVTSGLGIKKRYETWEGRHLSAIRRPHPWLATTSNIVIHLTVALSSLIFDLCSLSYLSSLHCSLLPELLLRHHEAQELRFFHLFFAL